MHLHLYLIRHGETVDNVKSIIAGIRDSELTGHGYLQAKRLAAHLSARDTNLTHIFASPLNRANVTAQAIAERQPNAMFMSVPELKEQDFGLYEGEAYSTFREMQNDERGTSVETTDEMVVRAKAFLNEFLLPIVHGGVGKVVNVAVVSHGCMLRVLWREIIAKFKPKSIVCEQAMLMESQSIDTMRLGHWSNTGVLEVEFSQFEAPKSVGQMPERGSSASKEKKVSEYSGSALNPWTARILAINSRDHLKNLKRTAGGIGSSQYDSKQHTLDSFFKRPGS